MSIGGNGKRKFRWANCATMTNVSMNGDYDFWYGIKAINGKVITLEGRKTFDAKIKVDKNGYEYFMVEHKGVYTALFGGRSERIKCVPFLDVSGEFKHIKPMEEEPPQPKQEWKPERVPNEKLSQEEREHHSKQLVKIADAMESCYDDPQMMRELKRDYKFHADQLFCKALRAGTAQ